MPLYPILIRSGGFCNPCLKSILDCILSFIPIPLKIGCAYKCFRTGYASSDGWGNVKNTGQCILACTDAEKLASKVLRTILVWLPVLECAVDIALNCFNTPFSRRFASEVQTNFLSKHERKVEHESEGEREG
jgi:hypothetical protein